MLWGAIGTGSWRRRTGRRFMLWGAIALRKRSPRWGDCAHGASLEVVIFLALPHPPPLRERDEIGFLPLVHRAIENTDAGTGTPHGSLGVIWFVVGKGRKGRPSPRRAVKANSRCTLRWRHRRSTPTTRTPWPTRFWTPWRVGGGSRCAALPRPLLGRRPQSPRCGGW
jgi:hypothetical protein